MTEQVLAASYADVDMAVRVQDVHLTYRTNIERTPTLKTALLRLGRRQRIIREVEALKGVSVEVPSGTVLGIMGANGAGKSTLVRTIAGILPPTKGRIEVRGKISTLLSIGVGFNGQLTGRENVVLGGLAAGLSRSEIQDRFETIAKWAELEDWMDVPMSAYSSGMFARLGFAVAVHMDPDILLIDEALSTGDARFKTKSQAKMRELMSQARAIIIVSHATQTILDMCDRALWLDKGNVMGSGDPEEVVGAYENFMGVGKGAKASREDL